MVVRTGAATVRQSRAPRASCLEIYVSLYIYIYTYLFIYLDIDRYRYIYIYIHIYLYIYIYTYMCVCVCVCLHKCACAKPYSRDLGVQGGRAKGCPALRHRATRCPEQSMQKRPQSFETSQRANGPCVDIRFLGSLNS